MKKTTFDEQAGTIQNRLMEIVQKRKDDEREKGIDALVERMRREGKSGDRVFLSMVYDFEEAPKTTNVRQLQEVGVRVPTTEDVKAMNDGKVSATLWELINSLAKLQVFLQWTDHLDDRTLLSRLVGEALHEPVADLGLRSGACEVLDMHDPEHDPDFYKRESRPSSEKKRDHLLPKAPFDR